MKLGTVEPRSRRNITNPQKGADKPKKPQGDKHLQLIQRQIAEVQNKIAELQRLKEKEEVSLALKKSKSSKQLPSTVCIEVPVERIVEREIIENVEVDVEREVIEEQPQIVRKIVEVPKEVKKIITVPKIMIRPKTPPKEIVVEVVQIKEVLVEVTEPINTHLAEQLKAITCREQELERTYADRRRLLERLKDEYQALIIPG